MSRLITAAVTVGLLVLIALVVISPYNLYVVRTGSMTPSIPAQSAVFVDPAALPQVRDVVTFRYRGQVTTHRLIAIRRNGTLVTKGDANRTPDQWKLTNANVIGTVVAHLPKLGWAMIYLRQPTGLLSLLLLPVLMRLAWTITEPASRPQHSRDGDEEGGR